MSDKEEMDQETLLKEIAELKQQNLLLKEQKEKSEDEPLPKKEKLGALDYVVRPVGESLWSVFHNFGGGKYEHPFEVMYIHPETINEGQSFQVRINDIGKKWHKAGHEFDIGIGVINTKAAEGSNRVKYGFDLGFVSSDSKVLHLVSADETKEEDCPDSTLINGDIVTVEVTEHGVVTRRNDKKSTEFSHDHHNPEFEYQIVIGMDNRFGKVTLAYDTDFANKSIESLKKFPKKDCRIYVATINEGSPNYASGVAKGGNHLLKDGTLVRRLSEAGRRICNYQPGFEASAYDAKFGANLVLSDMFPGGLRRNRIQFGGNIITVKKTAHNDFSAIIQSIMTGYSKKFSGSDADWLKERDALLSYGEKFLIDLPSPVGTIGTSALTIAGTKCKTIANMVTRTLQFEVEQTEEGDKNTPALLLLGGDRCMSVGSISGSLRAYKDLCVIFFDAHFDFRDPDASEYQFGHGSPLFFLLQKHLRKALGEWEEKSDEEKARQPKIYQAEKFLKSTPQGAMYWESLKDNKRGYRGFNWLQDSQELNPKRIAFTGVRQKEVEAGSSLGSPLVSLFLNLLDLNECMYTKSMISEEGVTNIFPKMIEQFRGTFEKDYLDLKDAEFKLQNPDSEGKWIPPIFVSWDVDSIDPADMPCCIFQEPAGLVAEECLALADEIAHTRSLVAFETIEFNPDLWGGYRDEPIMWTINEFELGAHARSPREPVDKNKHRLDCQHATRLIHEMITRAFNPEPKCVETY